MATRPTKSKRGKTLGGKLQFITQIIPLGGFILAIKFDDGLTGTVDFKPTIKKGGVFRQLSDPRFFALAEIGDRGRTVVWPGEIDFDADALYLKATRSSAPKIASTL